MSTGCGDESHWPGIGGPFFDKNLEYVSRQPKGPKGTPKAAKWSPKGSQMDPKGIQMDPKGIQMDPEGNQMDPKGSQLDPKGSQMDPKGSQMDPKVAPRETKGAPKTPKGSQGDKLYIHKLPINRPSGPLVIQGKITLLYKHVILCAHLISHDGGGLCPP